MDGMGNLGQWGDSQNAGVLVARVVLDVFVYNGNSYTWIRDSHLNRSLTKSKPEQI